MVNIIYSNNFRACGIYHTIKLKIDITPFLLNVQNLCLFGKFILFGYCINDWQLFVFTWQGYRSASASETWVVIWCNRLIEIQINSVFLFIKLFLCLRLNYMVQWSGMNWYGDYIVLAFPNWWLPRIPFSGKSNNFKFEQYLGCYQSTMFNMITI